MTYSDAMTETPMVCSQDGCVVQDTPMHDAGHKYAQFRWNQADDAIADLSMRVRELEEGMQRELSETRQELSEADADAQGHAERCAAAVRVAQAAETYAEAPVGEQLRRGGPGTELRAALAQWRAVK